MLARTLFASLAAVPLLAQHNPFVVFPQDPVRHTITAASYVRRPNWNLGAEGHQQVHADWFRGVGDEGTACVAYGFYHWAADENLATAETYGVVLRTADPNGAPDPSPTGVIVQISGLSTPISPAGGRGSWLMIDGFAPPVALPCDQTWFQGVSFPANPAWPATDGHALWAADGLAAGSPATTGENHRPGAPSITWSVDPAGLTATARPWTTICGVLVDAPLLHLGGIDPTSTRTGILGGSSYGMNGLFPLIPNHGLDARLTDASMPQGLALLAVALDYGTPLPFGFPGHLWLDLPTTVSLGFALMSGGAGTIPIFAPGALPASAVGVNLKFQGMVFDPVTGFGRFTNTQTSLF